MGTAGGASRRTTSTWKCPIQEGAWRTKELKLKMTSAAKEHSWYEKGDTRRAKPWGSYKETSFEFILKITASISMAFITYVTYSRYFMCFNIFILTKLYYLYQDFTNRESEVQGGKVACPRPHS